jgi:hypothetical protein
MKNPFRCFISSPEIIRLTVMMYIRYPLSLRQVEDLLYERGIDLPLWPSGVSWQPERRNFGCFGGWFTLA